MKPEFYYEEGTKNQDDYYNDLLPKESPFMEPIRRWEQTMGFVTPIIWRNVVYILMLHLISICYIVLFFNRGGQILLPTYVFATAYYIFSGFGITGGVHRLWSHRAYKVKGPMKIVILIAYASAGQSPIYDWVRDHRVHHRKADTSADPHDINRSFFFSHVGWLMMKKHPHVIAEGKKVDMSDISGEPMIVWFDRNLITLKLVWCFVVPTLVPVYLFGESVSAAIVTVLIRYLLLTHATATINSVAHSFGFRPYNKNIKAAENIFANFLTLGEGSHNFHHTFPWDYKATENFCFSLTTFIIKSLESLGLVYDTREATQTYINYTASSKGVGHRK